MSRKSLVLAAAILALLLMLFRSSALHAITNQSGVRVALVYTPQEVGPEDTTRAVYDESLREAGIPFAWIASTDISLIGGDTLQRVYTAIVFPDGINTQLPEEAVRELSRYARLGGLVTIVGDAGTHTANGTYRPGSLFATVSGVDAFLYRTLHAKAFSSGPLHFPNASASARWKVPSGKIVDGDLSSYTYGPLTYPFPRAEILSDDVLVDAGDGATPMISRRPVGRGMVTYFALPLGYLRAHSDAFPMTFLSSQLTANSELPHLVPTPDGIGELIVNLHIDSSVEYLGIPNFQRRGLLRRAVRMEFDITAGPDLDRIGDGQGFDACGRGRAYVRVLMPYGEIGSHGGWAHNLFAKTLAENRYSPAEVRDLVDRNDRCLASITGKPVSSYAAPVGVHPQPMMTNVLDGLGIKGYYYTGDTGAPAERPFFNGKLVSTESWAFPIMPFGRVASIAEMRRAGISGARVQRWLEQTAEYAADRHAIFLVYSHSYDFLASAYADALAHFLDRIEVLQRSGRLQTTDMVAAATFMDRFIATTSVFARTADGVAVRLHNPDGLRSIAFALPSAWLRPSAPLPDGVRRTSTDHGYTIFAVDRDSPDLDVTFPGAAS
jgi:hypothetical protein